MKKYKGYQKEDFLTEYAKYYNETIKDLSPPIQEAIRVSPLAPSTLLPFKELNKMQEDGYFEIESGFSFEPDGSVHVSVLTPMPGVTPPMWDWWFGWHGCNADRYKLWHPLAHISAEWEDGKEDIAYIGRTSVIEEYLGKSYAKGSIQFKSPVELGLSPEVTDKKSEVVFICARVGLSNIPVDFGWLVHQVRSTEGGAEMRSRFWLGGQYVQFRTKGIFSKILSKLIRKIRPIYKQQANDLLTHCSEEMTHLASFLPQLYAEFNPKS
jgi:DAPG hydrolase PhiG domain